MENKTITIDELEERENIRTTVIRKSKNPANYLLKVWKLDLEDNSYYFAGRYSKLDIMQGDY